MKTNFIILTKAVLIAALFVMTATIYAGTKDMEAKKFIEETVAKIEPILKDYNRAFWKATATGKKEWYKKYEQKDIEYKKILSDKTAFKKVKELKKGKLSDFLKRDIDLLYLEFLENQIDPSLNEEISKKGASLENLFYTFRANVDGVEIPDNKIRETLKKSKDVKERKKYWEASKQVGAKVSNDLIELVKLRNKAAKELGFKNYYVMKLYLQEQTERDVFSVLDDLYKKTRKPYQELKNEIDAALAKRYGVTVQELRPWHYEDVFFQEVPQVFNVNLDKYFKNKDVIKIAADYYKGIGMDVSDILKGSDLFERKGKYQHAYCIDIDRKGDVRIMENVRPTAQWLQTTLHELGHGVYAKYHDAAKLPYMLRDAAHIFTTEGVAEMFGGLIYEPSWLINVALPEKKKEILETGAEIKKLERADALIFARWVMVMANFERELYKNPDQDLNGLWWNLVEKYQLLKRPEGRNSPDWAAKIHIASTPVYYHNYQLGRLFWAQMINYIDKHIGPADEVFVRGAGVGTYLIEKVFSPGMKWRWDIFVKKATGERLNAKYFVEEFVR